MSYDAVGYVMCAMEFSVYYDARIHLLYLLCIFSLPTPTILLCMYVCASFILTYFPSSLLCQRAAAAADGVASYSTVGDCTAAVHDCNSLPIMCSHGSNGGQKAYGRLVILYFRFVYLVSVSVYLAEAVMLPSIMSSYVIYALLLLLSPYIVLLFQILIWHI